MDAQQEAARAVVLGKELFLLEEKKPFHDLAIVQLHANPVTEGQPLAAGQLFHAGVMFRPPELQAILVALLPFRVGGKIKASLLVHCVGCRRE
jgi:hypothetical protein